MRSADNPAGQIGFVEDGGIEADKSLKLSSHKRKNLSRPKTLKIRPGKFKNRIELPLNFRARIQGFAIGQRGLGLFELAAIAFTCACIFVYSPNTARRYNNGFSGLLDLFQLIVECLND